LRYFEGRGGTVSFLGEPHQFVRLPLLDVGDGWDWQAPTGMSYWLNDELTFEFWKGEWHAIQETEICRPSGYVSFGRAVDHVVASGTCLTSAVACVADRWRVTVPMVVKNRTVLGDQAPRSVVGRTEERVTAVLFGAVCQELQNVLVALPVTRGALFGVGDVKPISAGVEVTFNSEGVRYGVC